MIEFRIGLQLVEALGPDNRWFCSLHHGCEINDPELLLRHYIKYGGAAGFAVRFAEAMGNENRWYCSQYYRQDINDPRILWDYYMKHAPMRTMGKSSHHESDDGLGNTSIAC